MARNAHEKAAPIRCGRKPVRLPQRRGRTLPEDSSQKSVLNRPALTEHHDQTGKSILKNTQTNKIKYDPYKYCSREHFYK